MYDKTLCLFDCIRIRSHTCKFTSKLVPDILGRWHTSELVPDKHFRKRRNTIFFVMDDFTLRVLKNIEKMILRKCVLSMLRVD